MKKLSLIFILISFYALLNAKTFLFIGDSITDGNWGSPNKYPCSSEERNNNDLNHILGHGFVEMTAGYFMGEYPHANYSFINRGISGETLHQIAMRWDKDVIDMNPDIVSILCGTNNIHYWLESNPSSLDEFDFKDYEETLDSLICKTIEELPDCHIFVCTPFVAKAGKVGEADNYNLRQLAIDSIASITREIAETDHSEKVYLIDFNKLSNSLLKENPDTSYWIWDGIHPTTPMHYRMAQEWIKTAKNLF